MTPKLDRAREAVAQFLKTSNPGDEFFLVVFSDSAKVVVPFTSSESDIRKQLAFSTPHGRTALLDALFLSMHEMKHARNSRKALIIISDGGDNASRYTLRELKNLIREADVQIHAIAILGPAGYRGRLADEMAGPALLGEIAGQTGGLLFEADEPSELPGIASKIGVALRNQYTLGYSPPNLEHDGKYHRVKVKLVEHKGDPRLRLSWRLGYYAPGP
jgi:Ca-activated chloride channel family protein